MSEPVMEAVGIAKTLGEGAGQVQALKDVHLSLNGGELALLMGPSGSGKTTLLSVLGCIMAPSTGSVRIRGHSTEGMTPEQLAALRRDHIGFIFQSYHLFPTLTAVDNVRLALDVRGDRSEDAYERSVEALAKVGLAHKIRSHPRELSGGEQQRVAIARALVGRPAAILADEPTAALDSKNGHAIMSVLADIAKGSENGVLVVTHDPRTVPYADRIIRIEDGEIVGEERNDEAKKAEAKKAARSLRQ
ncbi:MAG: ABC transporter ATP-binding protein [Xanthobacteraceae bacterium]|jgi:putative ABC transport system ATP-binding protein|nr:ABC transporter ATP-binding protein [Xanthobacteraceae bacterium]